jgi:hypothetical protein
MAYTPEILPNMFIVSENSARKDIQFLLDYLSINMTRPSIIQIDAGYYPVVDTITINLPFTLFLKGAGANITRFYADTGLANKPMFDIQSEVWFDKFEID